MHLSDDGLLGAFVANGSVNALGRLVHGAEGTERIQHEPHPGLAQFLQGEERGFAEFRDVGQHRHRTQGGSESAVFGQIRQRLGENHVCPRRPIGPGAVNGGIKTLAIVGIRAGHQDKRVIGAGIGGRLNAVAHFHRADEFLAGPMAAAFGLHLILQMAAGGSGAAHFPNGAREHESAAPTRIGIHQERQRCRVSDAADILADIIQRGETEIGEPEGGIGHAGPGKIERAKPSALRQHGAIGIDHARDLQGAFFLNRSAESRTGRRRRGRFALHQPVVANTAGVCNPRMGRLALLRPAMPVLLVRRRAFLTWRRIGGTVPP